MKDFSHNRFAEIQRFAVQPTFCAPGHHVDTHSPAEAAGQLAEEASIRARAVSRGAERRLWPWPGMIFVLLGTNVAIVATTVFLATSDRSFSVEPDYYLKAVDWDRNVAQRARNAALGWNVSVDMAPAGTPISARLVDHDQQPISGAQVKVVAFHNAHSGHRLEAVLEEIDPGLYRSTEVLMRPGLWELRVTAKVGGETFTQVVPHTVQEAGR